MRTIMSVHPDEVLAMAVFARVVEAHSFTGAAARTGLSKSAVSARVAQLEERLGVRLLNRTTRRISLTEAGAELYKRAASYRMRGERVDGNDLEAVIEAAEELLGNARRDREPAVLELMTYRYRGHSVADAGLTYRTKDEITDHRERDDPIALLARKLIERGALDEDGLEDLRARAKERVRNAVAFAEDSEPPDVDSPDFDSDPARESVR